MPRNLQHWTTCAPIGQAETTVSNIPVAIVTAVVPGFFAGAVAYGVVMQIIAMVTAQTIGLGCIAAVGILIALIAGFNSYIDWYDHRRLACIKHDQCAIGIVIDEPEHFPDGDTALNLLLSPFSPVDHIKGLYEVIEDKRQAGFNYPAVQEINTFPKLQSFFLGLPENEVINIYQTLVHTKLFPTANPNQEFQRHYFMKTPAVDDQYPGNFANLPDDSFNPNGATNPLFRYPTAFGDPYVFIHTEIEGHRFVAWLENVRDGLIAGTAAFGIICAICTFVSANPVLCSVLGAGAALIIAFLAWLFKHLTNNPNDKLPEKPNVNVQDTDFEKPFSTASKGDLVVVFGDWIMDMEHNQWFEIHPVKAWYHVCPGTTLIEPQEFVPEECQFDYTQMTQADFDAICALVQEAETVDPPGTTGMSMTGALSMLGGIKQNQTPVVK